jgi:hypothetical protein
MRLLRHLERLIIIRVPADWGRNWIDHLLLIQEMRGFRTNLSNHLFIVVLECVRRHHLWLFGTPLRGSYIERCRLHAWKTSVLLVELRVSVIVK